MEAKNYNNAERSIDAAEESSLPVDEDCTRVSEKFQPEFVFDADRSQDGVDLSEAVEALNSLHGFSFSEEDFSDSYSQSNSNSLCDPIVITFKRPTRRNSSMSLSVGSSLCDVDEDAELEPSIAAQISSSIYLSDGFELDDVSCFSDEQSEGTNVSVTKQIDDMQKTIKSLSLQKKKRQDKFLNCKSANLDLLGKLEGNEEKEQKLMELLNDNKQALLDIYGVEADIYGDACRRYSASAIVTTTPDKPIANGTRVKQLKTVGKTRSLLDPSHLKQMLGRLPSYRQRKGV